MSKCMAAASGGHSSAGSGNVYSAEEVWTGEYIDFGDGPEKIYCKVISGTATQGTGTYTIENAVPGWKKTISLDVQFHDGERSVPYIERNSNNVLNPNASYVMAILNNGSLTLGYGDSVPYLDFCAVAKYTKTTE